MVFEGGSEFQALCDKKKKNDVLVIPIIWPCDNDLGIVQDYWDDQKAADQSAFSFSRVLEKFLAWRSSEKLTPKKTLISNALIFWHTQWVTECYGRLYPLGLNMIYQEAYQCYYVIRF
jgi:hypothetical protein